MTLITVPVTEMDECLIVADGWWRRMYVDFPQINGISCIAHAELDDGHWTCESGLYNVPKTNIDKLERIMGDYSTQRISMLEALFLCPDIAKLKRRYRVDYSETEVLIDDLIEG